jgi:hypothetical protein
MNRDQITQALMFYSSQALWEFDSTTPVESISYNSIIWKDFFYIKPTEEELQQYYEESLVAYSAEDFYKTKRQQQYPSVEEQLDMIFHHGIDVWRSRIQNIKDNIPKGDA